MFPLYQFGRRRKGAAGLESGGGGGALGFWPEEDDGPAPVSGRTRARAAAADWAGWAEEREKGFGLAFGPKPKEDF